MRQTTAWFDRSFDRSYPADMLPELLTRLRGTPARLEELLRNSAQAERVTKSDGKWSAQENAGHLADIEPLWLARLEDYAAGRKALTPADLGNRSTESANHNARPLEGVLVDFRRARNTLMERVAAIDASAYADALPHPRLKTPMRLADHLYFVAEHDDHHLARIWELIGT